jgi:hypothetical protein
MTREMLKMVKESKQRSSELIRYANPKSKNRPSIESVTEILLSNIPYSGQRPVITTFIVTDYNKNDIIKSAHFNVEIENGKTFEITAYQHLKGRTQEEKEIDKTTSFPSRLFNIFHAEVAR